MKNPYEQYKEVQVNTSNKGQLVVMMYEGAIKNINNALDQFNPKSYDIVNQNIIKTQDIITELMVSLDKKAGDIAGKLESIYVYLNNRLLEANVEKNKDILIEVRGILESLLEAWRTAAKEYDAQTPAAGGINHSISIKG